MNKVLACCIVKNENPDHIFEWIEYHLKVGIDHIILYDNGELNSVFNLIEGSNFKDCVSVINWHKPSNSQNTAYTHCINSNKNVSWIAFIDIDEFIHIESKNNIKAFLDNYIDFGAVCLNWITYSANNHITKPKGLVLDNYTESIETKKNRVIKSITQPKKTIEFKNPHLPIFVDDAYGVDINFNKIGGPGGNIVYDTTYIKHFRTKSFEEWLIKLNRGRAYCSEHRQLLDVFWEYNPRMIDQKEYIYSLYHNQIVEYNNSNYTFVK